MRLNLSKLARVASHSTALALLRHDGSLDTAEFIASGALVAYEEGR